MISESFSVKTEQINFLQRIVLQASHRALNMQNLDRYAPAYGCFDRHYWAWKLVDYAEATFQRNVYPLAWMFKQTSPEQSAQRALLFDAVKAGLLYAVSIQHKDGSFDQAFPHEHSFGATAFLVHPLMEAYKTVQAQLDNATKQDIENCLYRAAQFLCRYDETHGLITNHRAGGVLSLLVCGEYFSEQQFTAHALGALDEILASQSSEGWFPEYDGADPGYQSLCVYYLAQVYRIRPDERLKTALGNALEFLAWFIHPDGTFGGEYGSRRTAVYYPGGIALLSKEFPLAKRMTAFMIQSILEKRCMSVLEVDMGNLAPLLSNYVLAMDAFSDDGDTDASGLQADNVVLPCEMENACRDFPQAGLFIRGTARYYAVFGASNGGVLKVFDRRNRSVLWNDGGYAAQLKNGEYLSTQVTAVSPVCKVSEKSIELSAPFYTMLRSLPTPFQFTGLRVLNLTVMRSKWLGNLVKAVLVKLLISGKRPSPMQLKRKVIFEAEKVCVQDRVELRRSLPLLRVACGLPFVSIHMASARYLERFPNQSDCPLQGRDGAALDIQQLLQQCYAVQEIEI